MASSTTRHRSSSFPFTPDMSQPHNTLSTEALLSHRLPFPARGLSGDSHTVFSPFDTFSFWFYNLGQTLSQEPPLLEKRKYRKRSEPLSPEDSHSLAHLKWGSEQPPSQLSRVWPRGLGRADRRRNRIESQLRCGLIEPACDPVSTPPSGGILQLL